MESASAIPCTAGIGEARELTDGEATVARMGARAGRGGTAVPAEGAAFTAAMTWLRTSGEGDLTGVAPVPVLLPPLMRGDGVPVGELSICDVPGTILLLVVGEITCTGIGTVVCETPGACCGIITACGCAWGPCC